MMVFVRPNAMLYQEAEVGELWLFGNCRASESGSTASGRLGRVLPYLWPNRLRSMIDVRLSDAA